MKEITRIHLAQTPFNVELPAKQELETYLAAIEASLHGDEDSLKEIEARMVELLNENGVIGEKVVTYDTVQIIKTRLGSPSEFADGNEVEVDASGRMTNEKRLMRDNDQAMIGGVLGGIAAYFGVNPLWVRLAAIVVALASLGTAVLLYIVLWITVPEAKTAADKLQMRGLPVTLSAIKQQTANMPQTSSAVKPIIVALRVLLGMGFALGAVAAILTTVAAVVAIVATSQDSIFNDNAWLMSAFGLAVLSGVLLTTLLCLVSYAVFTWKLRKGSVIAACIIIILGLTSFATAVGLGLYGGDIVRSTIDGMTQTKKIALNDTFIGAKGLISKGEYTGYITYKVTNGPSYAEIKSVSKTEIVPDVKFVRTNDTVEVTANDLPDDQCEGWYQFCLNHVSIIIYGPALDTIEVNSGNFVYGSATQPKLTVVTKKEGSFTVSESNVDLLQVTAGIGSSISAYEASIMSADVTLQPGADVSLGVIRDLRISIPASCPANSVAVVSVEDVARVRDGNGAILDSQDKLIQPCAKIIINNGTKDEIIE